MDTFTYKCIIAYTIIVHCMYFDGFMYVCSSEDLVTRKRYVILNLLVLKGPKTQIDIQTFIYKFEYMVMFWYIGTHRRAYRLIKQPYD